MTIKKKPEVPKDPEADQQSTFSSEDFPIVGIGASAGGLAALEAFFSSMVATVEPGMAFVVVQHLAPDHKSILAELIKRYTHMPVFEVEDGLRVRPNCIYIIPPNRDLNFLKGALHLLEPDTPRGWRLPIDFFFRSLAEDQHERAICIVLSGTGSDGTLGARAVKGEGGMVMAQNPESSEYDGMPRSAIATGLVDFVLPPTEMPAQLLAYARHAFAKTPRPVLPAAPSVEETFKKIFNLLRAQIGHDFSQYKLSTITRRSERRMAVHQIERVEEYLRFLQHNPVEVEALFHDLLIGVTNFFRDPEVFQGLEENVIPRLFADRPSGATIRVWVPACSTGEEAYSIAILLEEHLRTLNQNFKLQIFASDIDNRAIETARAGLYPASIAADVSPKRLARFFTQEPGGDYRISKNIRDLLVFSVQNILQDPPFSRLDLISCRNLLIYLDGTAQKRLLPLFHYALRPGGFLLLGASENVGEFTDLFAALDRKAKLYQRKTEGYNSPHPAVDKFQPAQAGKGRGQRPPENPQHKSRQPLRELVANLMLQEYGAAAALVDEHSEILYLHGRTGQFLEPAPGEAGMNILKMAREGLRHELTSMLHKVMVRQEPLRRSGLRIKNNGSSVLVNLTVLPVIAGAADMLNLYLVILEVASAKAAPVEPGLQVALEESNDGSSNKDAARILSLMQELSAKEEYFLAINEELETSNEELKSSNEEMQSVNEELQSTNEELETSKEELQSVNEELATVNAELQQKVADLARANNDMNNLLAGTGIGTVFVDHKLHIQRFTPTVTQVINLIQSDVGRPLGHIVSNFSNYDHLLGDVKAVLDTLVPKEVEVQTLTGAWFLLRIRPYRTLENVIEGAVLTFTEITDMHKAQIILQEAAALHRLAAETNNTQDAISLLGTKGEILTWNLAAEKLYGWSEAEALKLNIADLSPAGQREDTLARLQELGRGRPAKPAQWQQLTRDGQVVEVWLTANTLTDQDGAAYALAITARPASAKSRE